MHRFLIIALPILLFSSTSSYALTSDSSFGFGKSLFTDPDFLPVEEAFRFTSNIEGDNLILSWDIADGYYLYKDRLKFKVDEKLGALGTETYSEPGELKDDPSFGKVKVFHNYISIKLPATIKQGNELPVKVTYQGCADAGLCYPPQTKETLYVRNSDTTAPQLNNTDSASRSTNSASQLKDKTPILLNSANATRVSPTEPDLESANGIFSFIQTASLLSIVGIFFLLGIGLTFTPCVFPMVPIISSIIAGQKKPSTLKSFGLSLSYVLGMASTYALAGVITGMLGASANIQAYLQAPVVLITFSIVFVLLAFSMFGFYELQLPEPIRNRLNNTSQNIKGGQSIGVFFIGALSALIVSPCVSAPLAGALLYISATADATLGGLSLFALGLGMGVPLIAVGVGGAKFLPKAGHWMDVVKAGFGVMLIGVAIWLLERLLPSSVTLILWSLLIGLTAAQMGAFESAKVGRERLQKGLALFLVLYSVTLFVGAMTGAKDPLNPLNNITSSNRSLSSYNIDSEHKFKTIYSINELNLGIETSLTSAKPVLLDFYADWCISCKVMEREVFALPEVSELMAQFTLIQADVTKNSSENQDMLEKYKLFGPPSILFFDASGNEMLQHRIMGEVNKEQFIGHLKKVISSMSTPI